MKETTKILKEEPPISGVNFDRAYAELIENLRTRSAGRQEEKSPENALPQIIRQLELGSRIIQHIFACDKGEYERATKLIVGGIRKKYGSETVIISRLNLHGFEGRSNAAQKRAFSELAVNLERKLEQGERGVEVAIVQTDDLSSLFVESGDPRISEDSRVLHDIIQSFERGREVAIIFDKLPPNLKVLILYHIGLETGGQGFVRGFRSASQSQFKNGFHYSVPE